MQQHKLPALKYLFLAGEPLDEPTARWVSDALGGVAIVDNYWQTESGWPILSAQVGIEDTPRKFGSPSFPVYGFNVKLKSETGGAVGADEKAVLVIEAPLPPGALMTVWGDDERFVKTYLVPSATSRSTAPLTGRRATGMVTTSSSVVPTT